MVVNCRQTRPACVAWLNQLAAQATRKSGAKNTSAAGLELKYQVPFSAIRSAFHVECVIVCAPNQPHSPGSASMYLGERRPAGGSEHGREGTEATLTLMVAVGC